MQISIDTGQSSTEELTALIALLASLGGRLPGGTQVVHFAEDGSVRRGAAPVASATEPQDENDAPPPASEPAGQPLPVPGAVDATGVPWDDRIHSTPAKLNGDGSYRKKRGITEVYFGQIHGELAEAAANANPTTGTTTSGAASQPSDTAPTPDAPPPPADDEAPPPPADEPGPLADGAASAPTADKSEASAAAASATGAGKFAGFPDFVKAVNEIRPAPGIPYAELSTFAQSVGVAGGFKDMRLHPDLWEDFYAMAGGQ